MSGLLRRLLRRGPRSWVGEHDGRAAPPEPRLTGERLGDLRVRPGPAPSERDLPRVAVVVPNLNGLHHLDRCFGSLRASVYPEKRLEVVLVDNGSSDGSAESVARDHGWVTLVANERNRGFSAACNRGAAEAKRPEIVVFLNNDMRVEPGFLRALVAPIARGECASTTAKMMSWDGERVNSAGGGMNFHGIGIQKGWEEEPRPEHDVPSRTLFACGGAMAIDARVLEDSGGFDEEFFAYYEDVDLGWRLWVLGHEVHYVPGAVCYHHHSSTSRTFPRETIRLLQVRNPLLACFKNYDDANLARVLPAAVALAVRRMTISSGIAGDPSFRIEGQEPPESGVVGSLWRRAKRAADDTAPIRRTAGADLLALDDLLGRYEHWSRRREEVQRRRRRPDEEILGLFHKPLWCVEDDPAYRELHFGLARRLGIDKMFQGLTAEGPEPKR